VIGGALEGSKYLKVFFLPLNLALDARIFFFTSAKANFFVIRLLFL
jgi:hypothetical protein